MGFRARILFAFCILGVLPLFITGALGYALSASLVQAVAGARAQADIQRVARGLDGMAGTADSSSWSGLEAGSWRPSGATSSLTRTFLVDRDRKRAASIDGRGAVTPAESQLALEGALGLVQASSADRIVTLEDSRWVVVSTSLRDPRWALVGLGSLEALTGLVNRAQRTYLGFVLVVALCIGIGLTFLVRPIVRSLEDLTEATNLIGDGDLAPWLPAQAEGEVGRLSLATGAMVERVERMMRGVEQGARMAMVGQLATHLAHEIRNPLSSIKLNLQSLGR
jgi:signal transduction histidine kinase